jgi:hypothetical protein
MSEHFLGSNKGFEILANSVQNPLPDGCLSFMFHVLREQQFSWVVPKKHIYLSIPTTGVKINLCQNLWRARAGLKNVT